MTGEHVINIELTETRWVHRANSKSLKEINASEGQEKHSELESGRDGGLRDFTRAEKCGVRWQLKPCFPSSLLRCIFVLGRVMHRPDKTFCGEI